MPRTSLDGRHERPGLPEVPNGLALCKIHHSAYDVNILGVSPDYRVHIRSDVLREHDGPMLKWGLEPSASSTACAIAICDRSAMKR
jgi:putative restriction endonuclease